MTDSSISVTFIPSEDVATARYFELTLKMSREYEARTIGILVECPVSKVNLHITQYTDVLVARCRVAAKKYDHSIMICVVSKGTYDCMRAQFQTETFVSGNTNCEFMSKTASANLRRYKVGQMLESKDQIIVTVAA
jgi:hypothetical protein